MWFKTHEPKKGSKLDDAFAATKVSEMLFPHFDSFLSFSSVFLTKISCGVDVIECLYDVHHLLVVTTWEEAIESELSQFEDDTCGPTTLDDIFKNVVGEDKNGYAKTFGMGIKAPHSYIKRCALEEKWAKRIKIEQDHKETKEKVHKPEKMMLILLKHQVCLVSSFSLLIC